MLVHFLALPVKLVDIHLLVQHSLIKQKPPARKADTAATAPTAATVIVTGSPFNTSSHKAIISTKTTVTFLKNISFI